MTRNLVDEETAQRNRERGGGAYTFHAPIASDYEGVALVYVAVRVGDHAHVDVESGRVRRADQTRYEAQARAEHDTRRLNHGYAGHLILRWPEWLILREVLDADPRVWIFEVENPTPGQARYHSGGRLERKVSAA